VETDTPVDILVRWEASGAVWRVAARTADRVTVDLLTCDEREVVGSVVGTAAELDGYLDGRADSLGVSGDQPPGDQPPGD
jgi:hypothetical protein